MANKLKEIPLSEIKENPVALREVNREADEFKTLVDSVRSRGILNAISVREHKDPETGEKFYYVIDGLHRFTAAGEAGLETIPATITTANDAETLELQLIANSHKIETKPHEYSVQLTRILANNPTMTQSELAAKLNQSPAWLGQRLGIYKVTKEIAPLVDAGTITLSNAIALGKLPAEEQQNFVERAISMSPVEFTPTANQRVKELRDAKRQGREPKPQEFVPVPHLRRLGELKTAMENPNEIVASIREKGHKTPHDIVKAVLEYVLHLDEESVSSARAKDDARRAEEDSKKEARAAERKAKKEAQAAEAQAAVKAQTVSA